MWELDGRNFVLATPRSNKTKDSMGNLPTADSKIPRNSRETRSPVKLCAAVMPHRMAPQAKTIKAKNLPTGNLTRM
jgi:hypothetical protein